MGIFIFLWTEFILRGKPKTGAIPYGMGATEQNFSALGYLRYYHTPIINQ
jgi:hypothetical protein